MTNQQLINEIYTACAKQGLPGLCKALRPILAQPQLMDELGDILRAALAPRPMTLDEDVEQEDPEFTVAMFEAAAVPDIGYWEWVERQHKAQAGPVKAEQRICEVDFDEAQYLGSSEDGVYFDVARGEQTDKWYMSASVDCNSSHFTDSLVADDGPYDTKKEALRAGLNAAYEWLVNNNVRGWRGDFAKLTRKFNKEAK